MLDRITCIKSFVRTVETGSFSAVAREMNTTQPAKVKCFIDFLIDEFVGVASRSENQELS
jgi:DNA-binding transcriptional LysR family regulator